MYELNYKGSEVDEAVGKVLENGTKWDSKQDALTGQEGQVVGFNADGEPVAQDAPSGLPDGGQTGYVLRYGENGPEWADVPDPLPDGGTEGQLMTKTADGTAWQDKPAYTADEVGARPSTWTPSAADVGAMPAVSGGSTGQVLTKTADGQAWQNPPASGMTETEADARYLQLSGGTMTGNLNFSGGGKIYEYNPSTTTLRIEFGESGIDINPEGILLTNGSLDVGQAIRFRSSLNMDGIPITNCPSITTSTDQIVTLSSGSWTSSGGVYQQTVNVTGVTADTPVIIVNPSLSTTDADANDTILEAWGKIAKLEISQGAGTLTFRSTESLTVNVPVKVGIC